MLIRFTVNNFLNFRDEIQLQMFPGQGQQPPRHIIPPKDKEDIPVLKTAAIFGPNASGKSNILKAMFTARNMILKSATRDERFEDQRFKFKKSYLLKPTSFEFEIKASAYNYAYGFSYTPELIQREWLYRISKTEQKLIFEKESPESGYKIEESYFNEFPDQYKRMKMIAEDVLPNQLFLSTIKDRKIDDLAIALDLLDVFNWFKDLTIVTPESRYLRHYVLPFEDEFSKKFKDLIMRFDTGIDNVELKSISDEKIGREIPEELLQDSKINLKPGIIGIYLAKDHNQYLLIKNKNDELTIKELMTHHRGADPDCWLEISEESDGTRRLTDLLPILINAAMKKNMIFAVDELDRSLHPMLTKFFVCTFLDVSQNTQLIFTAHEKGLQDQNIFRKDEIWYLEKNDQGYSELRSLAEYKDIRKDLDIEKGYMAGRFGALPIVAAVCENKKTYKSNS